MFLDAGIAWHATLEKSATTTSPHQRKNQKKSKNIVPRIHTEWGIPELSRWF